MDSFRQGLNDFLGAVNAVIWHDSVLYILLVVGVLFTVWSGFSQFRALTHGTLIVAGRFESKEDSGAISHFQALSAALSATVGLGNIAGVAVAISLGGPGAVFWMWVVALVGMALKTTEVTLAMLYRNLDNPKDPHGGAMWVAERGFTEMGYPKFGKAVGWLFCITLLISAITGGNMFQAWNVGVITETYFRTPQLAVGIILAVLCAMVIIGGIRRIGAVAGNLVPFMCGVYLLGAIYIVFTEIHRVPEMFVLIFRSAFSTASADHAFLGGTAGYAFLWGMKRALFSNEAGQGSSPIAHSAARTDEPVREGVVAGLEPFIDTIVVCTLTTLVVLLTGAWNRGPEAYFEEPGRIAAAGDKGWVLEGTKLPSKVPEAVAINGKWGPGDTVFALIEADLDESTGRDIRRLTGTIVIEEEALTIQWTPYASQMTPKLLPEADGRIGLYNDFVGAALTGHAFDRVQPGMGKWVVTIAAWLFAFSTLISWSYYGEQGIVFMFGPRMVLPYKIIYCILIVVACSGFVRTDVELDNLTAVGTGVMLWVNIPIMLVFGQKAMRAYHAYFKSPASKVPPRK